MPLLQAAVKCDLIDAGFLFSTYDILKLFISEAEKKKKKLWFVFTLGWLKTYLVV